MLYTGCCSGWNCNHERSNLEISAYGVSRRLNKSVCWNPCKSVWFATDNWELKAQRRLQRCIINIPFHFPHKIYFYAFVVREGWLKHHVIIAHSSGEGFRPVLALRLVFCCSMPSFSFFSPPNLVSMMKYKQHCKSSVSENVWHKNKAAAISHVYLIIYE